MGQGKSYLFLVRRAVQIDPVTLFWRLIAAYLTHPMYSFLVYLSFSTVWPQAACLWSASLPLWFPSKGNREEIAPCAIKVSLYAMFIYIKYIQDMTSLNSEKLETM